MRLMLAHRLFRRRQPQPGSVPVSRRLLLFLALVSLIVPSNAHAADPAAEPTTHVVTIRPEDRFGTDGQYVWWIRIDRFGGKYGQGQVHSYLSVVSRADRQPVQVDAMWDQHGLEFGGASLGQGWLTWQRCITLFLASGDSRGYKCAVMARELASGRQIVVASTEGNFSPSPRIVGHRLIWESEPVPPKPNAPSSQFNTTAIYSHDLSVLATAAVLPQPVTLADAVPEVARVGENCFIWLEQVRYSGFHYRTEHVS